MVKSVMTEKGFEADITFKETPIGSGGGVGKVTAEWLMTGHINEDIFSYDIKRFQKFHSELGFIKKRITETLGDLYGMHWPFKQHKTPLEILKLYLTMII